MDIQVIGPTVYHHPPIPLNSSRLIPYCQSGIYLLKRMSKFGVEHYGVAIHGNELLSHCGFSDGQTRVIHKQTNGIGPDLIGTFEWKIVGQVQSNQIPDAINRLYLSRMFWNEYDLIKDNCEHFARYVTEGQKQSTQVQTFGLVAAWLGLLGIAVFANRGDN